METFIFRLGTAVATQVVGIFGAFFACGAVLSLLERATHQAYLRSFGWRGILWTGWIGTPIHELGHVVLAKLFRHRIHRIALFQPNPRTGMLGSVDHSYNPKSLYQRIGNFFVGAAPLIFGGALLALLLALLVPNGRDIFRPLTGTPSDIKAILTATKETFQRLFAPENLRAWNFWLFLYISFAIASHIAPSNLDLRGMWRGFFWIVILLILANAAALLFGRDITALLLRVNQYLGVILAMFLYAILLSAMHLIAASILLFPFRK